MRTSIILGLTGPTGAGKSTVAACFSSCGCLVIDCDRLAREVTDTGCLSELTEAFGAEILDENGYLNRKALAQKAFSDNRASQRNHASGNPKKAVGEDSGSARTVSGGRH